MRDREQQLGMRNTGSQKGFDIYFQGKWAQVFWPLDWAKNDILRNITFLELPSGTLFRQHCPSKILKLHLKSKK
jgi:hypothetical protein